VTRAAQVGPLTPSELLAERARLLARKPAASGLQPALEILEFRLAAERYAVETRYVREVVALRELTPLPGTPAFIAGICSVRGQILAVIDLKRFFNLPSQGLTDLHRLVILDGEGLEFGLLADMTAGVYTLPLASLQPAPTTIGGQAANYFRGVTADHLALLDASRLLADPRLIVD
jgi:purine-binding chemotaxis protein CheW